MGIEVIARGWDRPEWCGAFYPEDLPQEWRLSYFANVFHAVLIPLDAWRQAVPGVLAAWAADVPEGFRFYLEVSPNACGPALDLDPLAGPIAQKIDGWVTQIPSSAPTLPDQMVDLPAWSRQGHRILARQALANLIVNPRDALAWLSALAVDARGNPALGVIAGGPAEDLRRWQDLILLAGLA